MSLLLLLLPTTPLLFMGQAWYATTPFAYFTNHAPELYRTALFVRRSDPFLRASERDNLSARADGDVLVVKHRVGDDVRVIAVTFGRRGEDWGNFGNEEMPRRGEVGSEPKADLSR